MSGGTSARLALVVAAFIAQAAARGDLHGLRLRTAAAARAAFRCREPGRPYGPLCGHCQFDGAGGLGRRRRLRRGAEERRWARQGARLEALAVGFIQSSLGPEIHGGRVPSG